MTVSQNYRLTKIALAVSAALLLASCASTPAPKMTMRAPAPVAVQAMSGYFPLEIQNDIGTGSTNLPVTNVYLLFSAKQGAAPNSQCLLSLQRDASITTYNAWTASCSPLTMATQASAYSYSMSTLSAPVPNAPVVIYIPPVISGRAFVSLNDSLDIPMTRAADGTVSIQAPSLGNPTDGNYNLIYDKFEYTYTPNASGQETFWIDTTSVDDFSLPIALSYTDPVTQAVQLNGYTNQDRTTVMNGITGVLAQYGNKDWQTLEVTDDVSGTGTIMRVDAPNTSPSFNPSYLTPTNSPFNYVNALINYLEAGNTLSVDCAEVYPGGTPAGTYTYTYNGTATNGKISFVNNPPAPTAPTTITIDLAAATSGEFFGPGVAPLDTPDGTVRSVIVKNLTALFSVGLLPAPSGTALSPSYFKAEKAANAYYQVNSIFNGTGYKAYTYTKGPWYDLYAKAVHSTSANPVYAFAFDDVLKQDGTISVINANDNQSQPVIVTFGSVDALQVPAAGPNYQVNPTANDIEAVTNVKNTGFNCTATSCTLSATWSVPQYQDPAVNYFILPSPSPTETATVLKDQPLLGSGSTGGTIVFPISSGKPVINQVMVYACIPHPTDTVAVGYDCPSEANGYALAPKVVGAHSSAQGAVLLPVSSISNPGFSCNGTTCTLSASWIVPAAEPAGTQFYINPLGNKYAPIADIMNGQQPLTTGSSATLTLPQADVTTTQASIIVSSCLNGQGMSCPTSANQYDQSQTVGSAVTPVN